MNDIDMDGDEQKFTCFICLAQNSKKINLDQIKEPGKYQDINDDAIVELRCLKKEVPEPQWICPESWCQYPNDP